MVKKKSFFESFLRRHHELVDCYGISVLQMIADMFLMSKLQSRPLYPNETYRCYYLHKQHDGCHMWSRINLPFRGTWCHPQFLVGFLLLSLDCSMLCFFFVYYCLSAGLFLFFQPWLCRRSALKVLQKAVTCSKSQKAQP